MFAEVEDREHVQISEFFAEERNYLRFEEYLAKNRIDPKKIPFTELVFKVCGYGYFPKFKKHMKTKFREYLWDSSNGCPELSSLKVTFNGFQINTMPNNEEPEEQQESQEHIFIDIIQSLEHIIRKRKIKIFHLHTTNLRKCTEKDLSKLFNLINMMGNEEYCEEISIQMTDWEFQGGYPDYKKLYQLLTEFLRGQPETLKFKKFRLELSAWYMKEKDGYKFLSKTLTNQEILEKFRKEQKPIQSKISAKEGEEQEDQHHGMEDLYFVSLPGEQQEQTKEALMYFIENLDKKFLQPKYPHKKSSESYDSEENKAHEFMLQEMKRTESIVSQRLVKYPAEYIMGLRVEEFHNKMAFFFGNLLVKMIQLQDYHIDMRSWNGIFRMGSLKKTLDTKVISSKNEFSNLRKSVLPGNKAANPGEEGVRTIYTM